jgi:dolichyl-diphosphooligosaccharide--protein glycosyltransferase
MALTGDHRVGLATVGVFAVTPMVALRSAFGFADHHAFDVALLAVMLYLVVVACGVQRPGLRWLGATVGASGAVAAQVLAWNAGALLVVPVAAAVLLWAILHLLEAQESLLPPATLVVVLVCGGAIAWVVHLLAGWQTVAIVTAPLAIGAVALVSGSVAMLLRRWGLRGLAPVGVLIVAIALALAVVRLQAPELWTRFITDATRLVTASGKADIHEAQSLFSGRYQVVLGPIYQLGVAWIPASIALGVGVHRGDVRWLVLAATASVLALLSLLEVRFTAELAVPVAVGAGAALVWGYDRLLETEADRRQRVVTAVTIAILVCGPGLFITVPQLASVTYDTETTVALDAIVADVTTSDADPTSVYVLSRWGHNRMYNAFIGEPQRGYGYARGTYESYLSAEPEAAVVSAAHGRSDYIVLGRYPEFDRAPSSVMYHRLWDDPTAVAGLEPILTEDELRVFRVTDTND